MGEEERKENNKEVLQLNNAMKQIQDKLHQENERTKTLSDEVTLWKDKHQEIVCENQSIQIHLSRVQEQHDLLEKEKEELRQQLRTEQGELGKKLDSMTATNSTLQHSLSEKSRELQQAEKEIEELKAKLKSI